MFLDGSAGYVAEPVPDGAPGHGSDVLFLPLADPEPLLSTGPLVELLVVPLHSGGSW